MPQGYVKKIAKEKGIPLEKAEEYWEKAKKAAEKQGHGEHYGYVTNIFKRMIHASLAAHPFIARASSFVARLSFSPNQLGGGK